MAFIKNDVSDEELDKLFNENDSSAFRKKEDKNNENESLLSSELDVKNDSPAKVERPEEYQRNEVRKEKIDERKKEEALLKSAKEKIVSINGQVSAKVFSEIAKARERAYLEEYQKAQAKIPKVNETAKFKIRSGDNHCTFHVYTPYHMIDNDHLMTSCKYCSESKILTLNDWMKYQLENKQYM